MVEREVEIKIVGGDQRRKKVVAYSPSPDSELVAICEFCKGELIWSVTHAATGSSVVPSRCYSQATAFELIAAYEPLASWQDLRGENYYREIQEHHDRWMRVRRNISRAYARICPDSADETKRVVHATKAAERAQA